MTKYSTWSLKLKSRNLFIKRDHTFLIDCWEVKRHLLPIEADNTTAHGNEIIRYSKFSKSQHYYGSVHAERIVLSYTNNHFSQIFLKNKSIRFTSYILKDQQNLQWTKKIWTKKFSEKQQKS